MLSISKQNADVSPALRWHCRTVRERITYVSQQLGHRDASITLRIYAHWLPDASQREVDRLDTLQPPATAAQPEALSAEEWEQAKSFVMSGEPRRNRTFNPQIKSLLLCQLS